MKLVNTLAKYANLAAKYSIITNAIVLLSGVSLLYCWWPVIQGGKGPRFFTLTFLSTYILLLSVGVKVLETKFKMHLETTSHSFEEAYTAIFMSVWFGFLSIVPFFAFLAIMLR